MARLLIALWMCLGLIAFDHAASKTLSNVRSPIRNLGVGSDRGEKKSAESSNVHKMVKQKKSASSSESRSKKMKATPSSASSRGKGKGGSKSSNASKGSGGSKSKKSSKGSGSSTVSSSSSKGTSANGSPSSPSSPSKGSSPPGTPTEPSMESEPSKDESPPASVEKPETAPTPEDVSEPATPPSAPAPVGNATGAPVVSPVGGNGTEATQAPVGGGVESPTEEPTVAKTEAPTEEPTVEKTEPPTEEPVAAVTGAPTDAQDDGSRNGEVFSIGNIRPEGITAGDGSELFFTNLFFGGIRKLDLSTNEITEVVPNVGYFDLPALGIVYDDGFLFVAGSGPGLTDNLNQTIAYVYNAESGNYVVACTADGNLWNDITIYGGTAYITDSRLNRIYTLDVDAAKIGECELGTIDLPARFFLAEGDAFLANGIDAHEAGLIIVSSATGLLFYHDLDAGTTIPISSMDESFPGGDGVLVEGDRVYVTNNQSNQIIVYDLEVDNEGFVAIATAKLVGTIESANFDSPSTSALIGGTLYSVNARFETVPFSDAEADLATFVEEFQIVATPIDAISA